MLLTSAFLLLLATDRCVHRTKEIYLDTLIQNHTINGCAEYTITHLYGIDLDAKTYKTRAVTTHCLCDNDDWNATGCAEFTTRAYSFAKAAFVLYDAEDPSWNLSVL